MYLGMADVQADHWWYRARRGIIGDFIRQMELPEEAAILECGCGPGGNLKMLGQFGRVDAFELDEEAAEQAQMLSPSSNIRVGAFPDRIPFEHEYDLAVALDVIEHVDDDDAAVAAMVSTLKPGGNILVTVPAYPWLWSAHDEKHHHKRRYVRPQLVALLKRHGVEICRATYFNTHLLPLIAGVRGAQKLVGKGGAAEDKMPHPATNRILEGIFASERTWLKISDYPVGVSILVWGRTTAS